MNLPLPEYWDMVKFYANPEEYLGICRDKKTGKVIKCPKHPSGLPSKEERKKQLDAYRRAQSKLNQEMEEKKKDGAD